MLSLVQSRDLIIFLVPPPLVWTSVECGRRGAIAAVLLLEATALGATAANMGPFSLMTGAPFAEQLLVAQAFVAWVSVMIWTTSRLMRRRDDALVLMQQTSVQLAEANRLLAEQAMHDGLTGLANRRCFDAALEREWLRAAREKDSLSLLLLDVDHFKAFNDLYGHQAGDNGLRKVAVAIRHSACRPGDFAARYGGEEFAVLLPSTGQASARHLADRLRTAVAALGVQHRGNPSGALTASVGSATARPCDGSAPEALLAAADAALYAAKSAGRNRVACAPGIQDLAPPEPASKEKLIGVESAR